MKIAIYPGSFDPVTVGHIDVICRAAQLFDRVIVAVMHNMTKKPVFTSEERMDFLRRSIHGLDNVEVDGFNGLLAEYAAKRGACVLIKGLRAVSDFEYEFQQALGNRKINPKIDTVFLTTNVQYMYLSSSMVKDIACHGGDIAEFVPAEITGEVTRRLRGKGGDL